MAGAFAPARACLRRAAELTLAFLPVGELPLGFLFRDPVRFLDLAGELIALARNHVELVVGELALLLLDIALELLPVAFHLIPVHFDLLTLIEHP